MEKEKTNVVKSVLWRLPFDSWGSKYDDALRMIREQSEEDEIAFFYIRSRAADRRFVCFLKNLRNTYNNAKIILEIPTYPYAKEFLKNSTMWPWYFKDAVYNRYLKKYVDRIVTFSNDSEIFGIKTIKSMNGMDVSSFSLAKANLENNTISIIGVAMMQPYHGFERIIKGLGTYYKNGGDRNVKINFVGYGPELDAYKNLTEEYNLTDRVIFKGKLSGEGLDRSYDG